MSPAIYKRCEKDVIVYNNDSFKRTFENVEKMSYTFWSYTRRQTKKDVRYIYGADQGRSVY